MTDPARTTVIESAPKRIYLQYDAEDDGHPDDWNWDETMWCEDRNAVSDIEYVRADAADALRAQVAALQAELAAAQAKLAVPVPEEVAKMIKAMRESPDESFGEAWNAMWIANQADAVEALARDNAALRTQAEALERERDGLRETLQLIVDLAYDRWQQPDGKLMTHVDNAGQRCWIIAAGVLDEARAALAEKP